MFSPCYTFEFNGKNKQSNNLKKATYNSKEKRKTLTFNRYSFRLIIRVKENTCEFRDGFSQTNLLNFSTSTYHRNMNGTFIKSTVQWWEMSVSNFISVIHSRFRIRMYIVNYTTI